MNALVISGEGCKGGRAGYHKQCKKDYNLYVGTSIGSLLVPYIALCAIDRIKKLYTTV